MNRLSQLMLLMLALSSYSMATNQHTLQFETIDIYDGLSQNSVLSITKDKNGFMWFGTEDGLNRYDGLSFKQFRYDPMDSTSLNSNSIFSSLLDSHGNLWIGTFVSGLNRYDDDTESFVRYPCKPIDSLALGRGSIRALHEDGQGFIWMGTSGGGLYRLDLRDNSAQKVGDLVTNDGKLAHREVYALFEDHDQNLWISTLDGLNVLDLKTYEMRTYKYDKDDPTSLYDNSVNSVYESFDGTQYKIWVGTNWGGFDLYDPSIDGFIHYGFQSSTNPDYPETSITRIIQVSQDQLWLGTDSKGIFIMDLEGNLLNIIGKKVYDQVALKDDGISSFYDDGDILWVGTAGSGVAKYNRNRKQFYNLSYDPLNPDGLHDNRILRIIEDGHGNLWIATWSAGLTYFNRRDGTYKRYQHDPDDPGSLSDNGIQDLIVDRHSNLWVVTASTKLDLLRYGEENFQHIEAEMDNPKGLQSEYILSLVEDSAGYIWLGSWEEGLFRLDPESMEFQTFRSPGINDITLGNISYYAMYEDKKGMLWIGAENQGLIQFDRQKMTLQQFKTIPGDSTSLPNNDIMCFLEDRVGNMWVGTYGGGLSKFKEKTGTFESISTKDGLPSNSIYGVFEDLQGALWMSTNSGLAKYDPQSNTINIYGPADGILSKEFNPAACQAHDGWLFFGGVMGITYFNPNEIRDNTHPPIVTLTGLSIMNEPVGINEPINGRVVLDKAMTTAPTLDLYHDDLFFTLSFASLDYFHSPSNRYAYYLEGFHETWRQVGTQNTATFSNLSPGEYTFHLRGSNNDGVWSESSASLQIIKHPRFFETWWFKLSGLIVLAILTIIAYRLRTNYLVKRGEELEKHNIQLNAQIESRRKAHVRANERANYFRAVISQSPIPMAIHNSEGHITHLNSGWVNLWGAESAEQIIKDYHVEEDEMSIQLDLGNSFRQAVKGNIIEKPEVHFTDTKGNDKVVQVLLYPLRNIVGMTNQVMVALDDVTEVVNQRQELEKSLLEKDLLLKEVHHRVKNNLQLVASLLGLQKSVSKSETTSQTLEDIKNRVNSMALVHDALYRSPELHNIDILQYINELTDTLQTAFGQQAAPVEIVTRIPEINLPVDIAVPCGLMINEMITNTLKYAFPKDFSGSKQIIVQFTEFGDEQLRLEVIDTGIGLQQPVVWDSIHSLGLYLVKILSEQQLMGSVQLKDAPGAHFVIEFPIHPNFDD